MRPLCSTTAPPLGPGKQGSACLEPPGAPVDHFSVGVRQFPCLSSAGVRWRGGQLHRDAEPAGGPGGESEGSVVCLGDAFDDCQAEADTCVVCAYAFGAAKKRLGKRGNYLWFELLAGV